MPDSSLSGKVAAVKVEMAVEIVDDVAEEVTLPKFRPR